jgi:DNA-binding CsgD family transcriptional regulator
MTHPVRCRVLHAQLNNRQFVGRRAELAWMREAWQGALAGTPGVLVVAGGSGAGKTALMERFLQEAELPRVVWVGSEPTGSELPWRVLRDVAGSLSAWTGGTAAWAERDPTANPAHAVRPFLDELAKAGPVALVIDDVRWADAQSQTVLRFAAHTMRAMRALMIVGCDDESLSGNGWERLSPRASGGLLRLSGLGPGELVRLAEGLGRIGLSTSGAARLHDHTGGNPLFAIEVLRQVQVREINAGHGPLPAPRSVAETVAEQLGAGTGPVHRLAQAAAVLGAEFEFAEAVALAGLTGGAGLLDELTALGLVSEVPATAGQRFRFSHWLIHQAVYDQTPFARRRELHRMAASRAGQVAATRHRLAAADGADPALTADLDRQAKAHIQRGELAAAATCWRESLRRTPPSCPERTPRLLYLVETELIVGNVRSAEPYAAELASRGGDPWWDYVAGYQLMLTGHIAPARQRLGRALATVNGTSAPGGPADLRARIATQLAVIAVVSLAYRDMISFGEVAVTADSADPRVRAFAWFARTLGLTLAGDGARARADLAVRDPESDLDLLAARGMAELWMDDLDSAVADLADAVNRAYQGESLRVGQALAFLGDAEYRRGNLADSVVHTEQAVWQAEASGHVWDYALLRGLACQARAACGDWAQARAHARAAAKNAEDWASVVGTRSGVLAATLARAAIAQALGHPRELLAVAADADAVLDAPEPGITLLGSLRSEALALLGDADGAESALAEYEERFAASGRKSALMAIARARGRILAVRGDRASALAAYADALALADAVGLRLEASRIEMLMGQCLADSGRKSGAGMRLRAALRSFNKMGARAYAAQAIALIRGSGLPYDDLQDPASPLADLTDAQERVVRLVGDGRSNREIAKLLSMQGPKSVEQHLTSIYQKLGLVRDHRAALRRLVNGVG